MSVIVMKCRARRGVTIQGIEEPGAGAGEWTLRLDTNSRGTAATVTAFRRQQRDKVEEKEGEQEKQQQYSG